jgi:hypothetical protein
MDAKTSELTKHETSAGDHDKFAHYAPRAQILEAYVTGTPLTALCGKTWVPFGDPEKYPVCPECKTIYDATFAEFNGGCGND